MILEENMLLTEATMKFDRYEIESTCEWCSLHRKMCLLHIGIVLDILILFVKIERSMYMKSLCTEYEMPEWMSLLYGEMDMEIVVKLRKEDSQYVALKEELNELSKKYLSLVELFDGDKGVNLNEEEQAAFHEYMVIRSEIEKKERQLFYYYGHVHCYEYMKRIGALK